MTTTVENREFVDQVVNEVVLPAADRLMESRYFTDLRQGKLTMRQLQGYALQHTWFNRALLKSGGLRIIKASYDDDATMGAIRGLVEEWSHPDLCQKFGLAIGLTDQDFRDTLPIYEVLSHTGAVVSSSLLMPSAAGRRTSGLANETIVQRYSSEFSTYLRKAPYNLDDDALEFFDLHGVVDVEHSAAAAVDVARLATTDRDKELVRWTAEMQVKLKLAKFEGIYDHYA